MNYCHRLNVLETEDDRDVVATGRFGAYYVKKKNLVGVFVFGVYDSYADGEKAFDAMRKFLHSRKDAAILRVTLIED